MVDVEDVKIYYTTDILSCGQSILKYIENDIFSIYPFADLLCSSDVCSCIETSHDFVVIKPFGSIMEELLKEFKNRDIIGTYWGMNIRRNLYSSNRIDILLRNKVLKFIRFVKIGYREYRLKKLIDIGQIFNGYGVE